MRLEQKPKYEMKLLSNGKTIKFRPFIVEEERNLLMALESQSFEEVLGTVRQIVGNCTGIDPYTIPYFDLENIFISLRSKSVGELVDMIGKCDCKEDAKTTFQINLDSVKMSGKLSDDKIAIADSDWHIRLRYPTAEDVFKSKQVDGIDFIASMIESMWNAEEVFDDEPLEGKKEFLLSLTAEQYKPIDDFYRTMPSVQLSTEWHCQHCGKKHDLRMTGLDDFFL
jgi:hypothetical protein